MVTSLGDRQMKNIFLVGTTAVPTADPVQWQHSKHPSQKEGKYLSVPVKRTALTVN